MDALFALVVENAAKGAPVELVSRAVLKAMEAPRPKARYPLSPMWLLAWMVPTRWVDRLLAKKLALSPRRTS
ncbi:MAG: hypothetical protein ACN6OP_23880 [Pseudomonadales bacterium]